MSRTSKPRKTLRRLGIAFFLGLPALMIAAVMPMQASGQIVSPATPGDAFLTITQSDFPDPAVEGDNVTYTVSVGNDPEAAIGPATSVTLHEYISPDVNFVSAIPQELGSCGGDVGGVVLCSLGTIYPDSEVAVDVTVQTTDRCSGGTERVNGDVLTEPCTIESHAIADSPDALTAAEDFDDTVVNPAPQPNVNISKSDSPDPVQELNPLTYTISMHNNGDANALNAILTDPLPAGSTFVSVSTNSGSCSHTATGVTCHLGTLSIVAEGATIVTIVVQAPNVASDMVITNTATVRASNMEDVSASADTTVLANDTGSTSGDVPSDSKAPVTFTTASQSTPNGGPAVDTDDPTGVSIKVPPHGPGGSVLLEELFCSAAPCSGPPTRPAAAGVVLGDVVYNVVPPDGYPNNKPFKATLLYDASLNPSQGPVYYFKDGFTTHEIKLHTCGAIGPGGMAPCIIFSGKLHTNNPLTDGDWKVIVRLHSDPKMRK